MNQMPINEERIVALERERDEAITARDGWKSVSQDFSEEANDNARRYTVAEANLAVAVEALKFYSHDSFIGNVARAALAKIEAEDAREKEAP